jgi:hypothetical protein
MPRRISLSIQAVRTFEEYSSCSDYRSIVKCPYCNRDDFVDGDSLNRHLSHNRQCSRADVDATDKLPMLLPDPSYTTQVRQVNPLLPGYIGTPLNLNADDSANHLLDLYQGNLVNFANGLDVHKPMTKIFQQGKEITVVIYDPQMKSTL